MKSVDVETVQSLRDSARHGSFKLLRLQNAKYWQGSYMESKVTSYTLSLMVAMLFMQALPKFQLVEENTGVLMTGPELDCHISHASRDGIGGSVSLLLHHHLVPEMWHAGLCNENSHLLHAVCAQGSCSKASNTQGSWQRL